VPFLYLPDALSLTLLIIVLVLLRRAAVVHVRQELAKIRNEALLFWSGNSLHLGSPAYRCLKAQIISAARVADKLSPARLLVASRLSRMPARAGLAVHPGESLEHYLRLINDNAVRKELRRIQLEIQLSLGVFYLLGSVSGWMLSLWLGVRVSRRTFSRRSHNSFDNLFDLAERLFAVIGRRAQSLSRTADLT